MTIFFLLSGPGVNKAVLLQLQKEQEKARKPLELNETNKQIHDNMGYEDIEAKDEPDSKFTKHSNKFLKEVVEKQEEEKDIRIDRF